MLALFDSIVNTIIALVNFLVHSITSLFTLIAHVPQYVAFLISAINVLPAVIIPFAIVSVTLGAVLFMLGR